MNLNEIKINVSFVELREILTNRGLESLYDLCKFSELDNKNKVFSRADKLIRFLNEVNFDFVAAFNLNPSLNYSSHCANDYAGNDNGIAFTFQAYPEKIKLDELFGGKE